VVARDPLRAGSPGELACVEVADGALGAGRVAVGAAGLLGPEAEVGEEPDGGRVDRVQALARDQWLVDLVARAGAALAADDVDTHRRAVFAARVAAVGGGERLEARVFRGVEAVVGRASRGREVLAVEHE